MNLSDHDALRETVFQIAADGARQHIKAGIIRRLRAVASQIVQACPDSAMARSLAAQVEAEIENIEGMK